MRAEWTAVALKPKCGECVIEALGELNERLGVSHTNPYDTRGPKVREGAAALERHGDRSHSSHDFARARANVSLH